MPYCETCERFYNPKSLAPDGTCMTCGRFLGDQVDDAADGERTRIPWHFWLLVIALVVYLGWRFVQMIGWLLN